MDVLLELAKAGGLPALLVGGTLYVQILLVTRVLDALQRIETALASIAKVACGNFSPKG